jgi:(1->4)-alpha-D-glucan 1-alpha-D-glucosylmutase
MKRRVVKRLQQYMSAVHAKGIEDTAFYRDNTLLALNEVAGDPGGVSGTLDEFHRFNEQRLRAWPHAQTSTSTHDTKLGEDARIRIGSLSAFAREWASAVRGWHAATGPLRVSDGRGPDVDVNDAYRFYQIAVGLWPASDTVGDGPVEPSLVDRICAFMRKSVREAQVHTSWMHANDPYESALDAFVRGVLAGEAGAEVRRSLRAMVRLVLPLSLCHSLSQLVLKCLMPGVPDVYQGAERWTLQATDPDNRGPVDFAGLHEALRRVADCDLETLLPRACVDDVLAGHVKQHVTGRLLRFRRQHRRLMSRASYAPLRTRGPRASSLVAFRRTFGNEHVVVAVPRFVEQSALRGEWPDSRTFWADTELRVPSQVRCWTNLLSGRPVVVERAARARVASLAGVWPWVVLHGHG